MSKAIQPGSKMDKLVKLFKAMRAIADLAPFGGGLSTADPVLMNMHTELSRRFVQQAAECGFAEHDAVVLCAAEVDSK